MKKKKQEEKKKNEKKGQIKLIKKLKLKDLKNSSVFIVNGKQAVYCKKTFNYFD